ncbi:unnamed protein product [Orchesella dallaii]|uniref:Uncharacterized protein n=1 Tax=Orchesella dallaii TaxID=48710 RepID=A0ABP1Q2U3_9HEXA
MKEQVEDELKEQRENEWNEQSEVEEYEDIFHQSTVKLPTQNVIVDAFMTSMLHPGDGYVPITWYTHFQVSYIKSHPKLRLASSIIKKDRVVCPVINTAHGIGHTYLFFIYPRRLQVEVFDSCPQFTSEALQTAHIQVLMKALYNGDEVPKYKAQQIETPSHTDDYSCALLC